MTRHGTDTDLSTTPSAQRWDTLASYRDNIVQLARRHGAGPDAEDVAHEALLRAASSPRLDLDRAKSYLSKVAVNLVVDLHRRTARDRVVHTHAALVPQPRSADEDVERIEERDLARHAARLADTLPSRLRDILVLRRDGATWPQVGASLHEHPATAEMRYRRAMGPLRRQLTLT